VLAVAALVALLPWRSEWEVVALFALLLALYSATLVTRPYADAGDNRLEGALLLVSTLLYSAQIAGNLGATPSESVLGAVGTLSMLAKGAVFVIIARDHAEKAAAWLRDRKARGSGDVAGPAAEDLNRQLLSAASEEAAVTEGRRV
jgi:hypothetical protein